MNNVTVTTQLRIHLTADQWQLYDSKPGAEQAAIEINRGIENALNESDSPVDASHRGFRVLRNFEKFGATDTEPTQVLDRLIRLRFPTWQR